jgi:hypothetical protein
MGWLYMDALGMSPHKGPKQYLDAQFTFKRREDHDEDFGGMRVLRSSCLRNQTYYAAVEKYDRAGKRICVFGVVCLVRYNKRASDGMVFGYKSISEDMGPCESECPTSILDLLTETEYEYAIEWRKRCRDAAKLRDRKLSDGDIIVFPEAMKFTDGSEHQRFKVRKEGRKTVLQTVEGYGRYQISRLMSRAFDIERPKKFTEVAFPKA